MAKFMSRKAEMANDVGKKKKKSITFPIPHPTLTFEKQAKWVLARSPGYQPAFVSIVLATPYVHV